MRLLFILLFITSCIKEDKLRSIEKYLVKKQEVSIAMDTILLYGDSNAGVLKGRLKNAIIDSYPGKASTNIPLTKYRSNNVSSVFFFIGTNDLYNVDTLSIKKIHKDLTEKFPNAKLYCVSGTHGWGTFRKIKMSKIKYIKYYKILENYGFKPIMTSYNRAKFRTVSGSHNPNSRYNKEIIDQINLNRKINN